jgi:pyruvate dehydrogenase E2 component (dihydrolipoamide acetyltransferase)
VTASFLTGVAVTMPQLGETVSEGTVTRWLKAVGDEVRFDEPLLEIATDKVDTEVPSPAAGTLLQILVPEDETVAVGAVLAVISATAGAGAPAVSPSPSPSPSPPRPGPRHRHSPRIRRRAHERGIDLATVVGTGPAGRVTEDDLVRVGAAMDAVPADAALRPARSVATTAVAGYGFATVEVDVTALLGPAATHGSEARSHLLAAITSASVEALRRHRPIRDVLIAVAGSEITLPDAHDLNQAGLRARFTQRPHGDRASGSAELRIADAGAVLLQVSPPREGEIAVIAVGGAVDRVVTLPSASGAVGFGPRCLVAVTISCVSAMLDDTAATDVLNRVRQRVEAAPAGTG